MRPQTDACLPAVARPRAGATLVGAAGRYGLTLVETGDGARSVRGTLMLYRQAQGLDALGGASTPLYGATDANLRDVGAHRVGDTASVDPRAPGVLALEFDRDGKRVVLLRLGSDANRRDAMLYDGAYTVLEVRDVAADGFTGSWRSGPGTPPIVRATGGYFCARRVASPTSTTPTNRRSSPVTTPSN